LSNTSIVCLVAAGTEFRSWHQLAKLLTATCCVGVAAIGKCKQSANINPSPKTFFMSLNKIFNLWE
jgi:hypothetical protein